MILFYDSFQTIRPADIDCARFQKNVAEFHQLYLHNQFRIRGKFEKSTAKDYIDAIRILLQMEQGDLKKEVFKEYDFGIADSMQELKDWITSKNKMQNSNRSRLVSGYAFVWESNKKKNKGKDICDFKQKKFRARWNRTNVGWIELEGSEKEVGSIHAVQGEDLNCVGVIVGNDIGINEDGRIILKKEHYHDRNGTPSRKGDNSRDNELLGYIKNIYYVLLTRGSDGCRVCFCDDRLRQYFKKQIYE